MARLTVGNTYGGFIVRRMTYVNEVGAELYELEHIRSGAKLIYLGCDDDNKVFSVMFRTMPEDSMACSISLSIRCSAALTVTL